MIDAHRQAFKEEAYELVAELETSLLALEEVPDDKETIGRVFRAMHTIKGSGAMFGFEDIATFTHEVETVFDLVRNDKIPVTKQLINLTLSARDQIKSMLDASDSGYPVDDAEAAAIILELKKLLPQSSGVSEPVNVASSKASSIPEGRPVTYRIRFKPAPEIFMTGTDPVKLIAELAALGTCRPIAQLSGIPALEEMQPDNCYVYWDIILTTSRGKDAIEDVFIFVADDCELSYEVIDDGSAEIEDDYKKLGEILVERGDISREDMDNILSLQKRFGELAVATGLAKPDDVQAALVEQQHVKEVRQERQVQQTDAGTSIRVPADKLDALVNLVGELVTVQARLSQTAVSKRDPELVNIAEEVERLSAELRDNALNIRMLPIGTTFSKFKRLVRDLSNELGKEIEMTTEGAETELDKTVIERLNDPLVHLIRNSIDHGIEGPEERVAAGKPRQGTVHLSAVHSGDSVLISITDDGAGLDRDAIRTKAVERGLIQASAELSDKEIYAQIFAPGFSTAKKVTSVSGRGVGMDVVKRAIDALRGTIDISSTRGVGSKITVKIPLTLAIIESLLVKIGADCFVLPLSLVNECIELTSEQSAVSNGRNLANVRGHMVPYVPLREHFKITGAPPAFQQIVITEVDGFRVGFVVDNVIGEHQTVIKSLGRAYKNVEGVSGATILGDGSVALILDIPHLMRGAELAERAV
ncbi:chemotaxis protein CheA [Geobacter pelophilus]|uniref:Chemotaxis protein CheA n=1 Tax=Geoanaerobacter pelophilus TaxID=60036 RepID=A0AAW4KVI4_9BACT|nr:chemotaxis protein CheA [Geoanaerobacter pelophilus]MBT0662674.1 chemotaxis protein CheA [Geoanaerobacter pelophilus]